jgi:hypothetical protein
MKRIEIRLLRDLLATEHDRLDDLDEGARCTNCMHWGATVCRKADQTPPDEILQAGCDEWEEPEEGPPQREVTYKSSNQPAMAKPPAVPIVPVRRSNPAWDDLDDDIPF